MRKFFSDIRANASGFARLFLAIVIVGALLAGALWLLQPGIGRH